MNNYIYKSWTRLESENHTGLVKRLISRNIPYQIYCIYDYSNKSFGIGVSYPKNIKINLTPFSSLSRLKIEVFEDTSFKNNLILSVLLSESDKKDLFSYLCVNMIETIAVARDIFTATQLFGNTLLRWKKLFESTLTDILSKEEQRGLYGELVFLRELVKLHPLSQYAAIQTYIGCSHAPHDFQGNSWAVEVKTTSTNNPQLLTINGERQLDDSMTGILFLCHCSVEVIKNSGETLPDIITEIKHILKSDFAALSLFNAKLFEAGYKEEFNHQYANIGYKNRFIRYYHVHENFPRIIETDLREGVGNVKYEISLPQSDLYRVTESFVLDKCTLDND
ncbi:MAG: PD-(D/E)XK motif protein [Muribaculaceae bacterium]|nr:PD-(D/E)XK motif protein [Muribaculaceae bacterium]